MFDLSIIIISFNTKRLLRECLDSVYNNIDNIEFEIFVVDNHSHDGSPEMVKSEFQEVKLIRNNENLGFAKANNIALSKAVGRFVLLLNSDTIVLNNALRKMIEFMYGHQNVGAVGPCLLNRDGTLQASCRRFQNLSSLIFPLIPILNRCPSKRITSKYIEKGFYDRIQKVDYISGACMMIRKKVLKNTGLFDEQFFMYSEEQDLCYRIHRQGWGINYFPNAKVIHYVSKSFDSKSNKKYQLFYISKYKLIKKYRGVLIGCYYKYLLTIILISRIMINGIISIFIKKKKDSAYQVVVRDFSIFFFGINNRKNI